MSDLFVDQASTGQQINLPGADLLYFPDFFSPAEADRKLHALHEQIAWQQGKITVYGKTHTITVPEGKTILKAAIDAGLEPPFSCTVGVCTTCRAKLSKGKVHMNEREGLSDDELNDNYILTCQSLARSSELEMVFE